jgi:hypothetical protein
VFIFTTEEDRVHSSEENSNHGASFEAHFVEHLMIFKVRTECKNILFPQTRYFPLRNLIQIDWYLHRDNKGHGQRDKFREEGIGRRFEELENTFD